MCADLPLYMLAQGGGEMIQEVHLDRFTYLPPPTRYAHPRTHKCTFICTYICTFHLMHFVFLLFIFTFNVASIAYCVAAKWRSLLCNKSSAFFRFLRS